MPRPNQPMPSFVRQLPDSGAAGQRTQRFVATFSTTHRFTLKVLGS